MSRRELLVGIVVVALLLVGVLFLGPPATPERDPSAEVVGAGGPAPEGAGPDRPADRRPDDPRRAEGPRPVAPTRPTTASESRAAAGAAASAGASVAVRVVDARGAPRSGVRVELMDGDPDIGAVRRFGAPAITDGNGAARLPWPSDVNVSRGLLAPALLLLESHALPIARSERDEVVLTTPDVGAVDVAFEDERGEPYVGAVEALLLHAQNDPPTDGLLRARATARAENGLARFAGVETGTLLLLEGRVADTALRAVPLQTEGPSVEGARLRARLRVVARGAASPRVRSFSPALGPPKAGVPTPGDGDGGLILRPTPAEALPSWPFVVEVVLAPAAGGPAEISARVDEKRVARLAPPAGSWRPQFRVWRATPDGWLAVDAAGAPATPLVVRKGGAADVSLPIDEASLAAAVAELSAY